MSDPIPMPDRFERELIREVEGGLPLAARPFAEIAERLGVSERRVIETLRDLVRSGVIKRFGVIVRHRELGYLANAMVVWDVPDEVVDDLGRRFGEAPYVTLCYRRPRHLPTWPYNLFTMIHGRDRAHVLDMVSRLQRLAPMRALPMEILFSGRRFKQRGARYAGHLYGPATVTELQGAEGSHASHR